MFLLGTIALTLHKRCCKSSSSIFYLHPHISSNAPEGTGKTLAFLGRATLGVKAPQEVAWAVVGLSHSCSSLAPRPRGAEQLSQAGGLPARPALEAEAVTRAPNEGVAGVPITSATSSLPAPFMAFYCPAGTKNRKWNGNIWKTRYDAASGKLPTHWLEFSIHL